MSVNRKKSCYFKLSEGIEMHYVEKGAGDPIIFIPGLTFSAEIFEAQVEYFSKTNRVIAIDPRGQGLSTKSLHGNDYTTHGQDIAKLIDTLNLTKVVLVGWSTGNLEVWSYVKQYGYEKIKAAVTIDMSPLPLSPDPDCWTEGSIEDLRFTTTQLLTSPEGSRNFFRDYAREIMIQHEMKPEQLEQILDISAKTPCYICHTLFTNAILSDYFATAKTVSETIPSLMFIAEHWSDIAEPFMHKNFPGTKTHIMGGHLMFYEYPEKWNHILEDFLKSIN